MKKNMKLYLPLKIKLALINTAIIALISAFVYYYFPSKFETERLESLKDKANSIAKLAAYGISSGLYFEDYESSNQEIETLIKNEEIRYVVIFRDDSVYYEYNTFTAVLNNYKNFEEGVISKKWEILKSWAPITVGEKNIGSIYIGYSLAPVYEKINELKSAIGIVSLVLFGIGALLAFLIGYYFTRPLSRIVDVVNNIANGSVLKKVNIESNDEIGILAKSFNEMVEKIHQSNKERNKINRELEIRVEERTLELKKVLKSLEQEIIQRKSVESEISKSLHEKEILLKEIHHRVKNNLQIVSSLFFFQSKQISDPSLLEMFREGQNRVKSMALIHEKLYQSDDLTNIDFKEYIKKLTNFLFQSFGINTSKVKLNNNVQKVSLGVDTAVPCGLIINELISNSLKHGLKDKENGEISIDLSYHDNDKLMLKISDNGKGIPSDFKIEESESLGLKLVYNLTTQLNGKVTFYNNNGTIVKIVFPNPAAK